MSGTKKLQIKVSFSSLVRNMFCRIEKKLGKKHSSFQSKAGSSIAPDHVVGSGGQLNLLALD